MTLRCSRTAEQVRQKASATWLVLVVVLAALAGCSGAPSPVAVAEARERLRPQFPQVVRTDFIEDCLLEKNVSAFQRLPNGGFEGSNVSDSDFKTLRDCIAASEERFPLSPAPATAAEFLVFYELLVRAADCLKETGIEVQVPSFNEYLAGDGSWTPYGDLSDDIASAALEERCPQDPWHYDTG